MLLILIPGCSPKEDADKNSGTPVRTPEAVIRSLVLQYPTPLREVIYADFSTFIELTYTLIAQKEPPLVLVDKTHRLTETYEPNDLIALDDIPTLHLTKRGMLSTTKAAAALRTMSAVMDALGLKLRISSSHRSFDYQKTLYEQSITYEGFAATAVSIAPPGASEHQLGTTFDFGDISLVFADTKEYAWLTEHAHSHGFILSYPDDLSWLTGYMYEPWHYRYVGVEAAAFSKRYFDEISYYTLHYLSKAADQLSEKDTNNYD